METDVTTNVSTQSNKLPKAPLIEAIFELRWALETRGQPGMQRDPGFRILLGRYFDRIREKFPVTEDLPTSEIPEELTAYAVRHRFRADHDAWPVTQIGPGILTVNETEGYTWPGFQSLVMEAQAALFEAYPSERALEPVRTELRYIDAIPFNPQKLDVLEYLKENLHTNVTVDQDLFDECVVRTSPTDMNLKLGFPLARPKGIGIISFAIGKKGDEPSIIMNTVVRSLNDDAPKQATGIEEWIDQAHAVTHKWFFTLIRGRLRSIFEGHDDNQHRSDF